MYEKRLDRTSPGCIMILVDQSGSMEEAVAGGAGESKAQALARAINDLLYELVIRCVKNPSEGPRDYYDLGLIGYGSSTGPAWGGALAGKEMISVSEVANNPVRVESATRAPAPHGELSTVTKAAKVPVWLDPVAAGRTPMCGAMDMAGRLVADWVGAHPDSFPPLVVNISDGAATDGDPTIWADRIRGLSTRDGHVLLFNLNLSAIDGEPVFFPSTEEGLVSSYARTLFQVSSPLPSYMVEIARSQGIDASEGSRGFVFNAGIEHLVKFLQIGTSTTLAGA